ncbi:MULTISPECIES: MarR family winged helix-turn-helix transcriptional regulator [Vallitalea]|uniref:MarR family transcriptional regulator n=2 Tax=Vallitalea TaxID=1348611 RepID=A0A8J8MBU6_9FIRM|nr:MarR family transcriptional regulator [Vallitalea guaymasensis]QUH30027.1 MarR family transcriptional regulator [Vallitalea guaymasensis]GMQ64090.1 MarR family transcriptional regulator [Vallitalea sp. AN17-2]
MKADNTLYLIGKVRVLINQFIISELKKKGINGIVPSHGNIILSLLKNKSLTMSELADKIGKDPSTITTLVKKLNDFGYTQMIKDEEDKRVNRVSLTSKGKELEEAFIIISEEIHNKQYNNISDNEKEVFRQVLNKMIDNFS